MSDLVIVEGFLAPEQCTELIGELEEGLKADTPPNANSDFDGREIHYARIRNGALKSTVRIARLYAARVAGAVWPGFKPVYPTYTDLVKWPPGSSLGEHRDDVSGYDSHRKVSAICYLNSDFYGGRTVVGESVIEPRTGMLVMYPAETPHSVRPVMRRRTRYTLAMWFTDDAMREEE